MEIYHVRQRESWDCGLACTQMVLNWHAVGNNSSSSSSHHSLTKFFNNSNNNKKLVPDSYYSGNTPLWTIDLYQILKDLNVKSTMYSSYMGVGDHLGQIDWYSQNNFDNDSKRIVNLFDRALNEGWNVIERITQNDDIEKHILNGHMVIVLIDANVLHDEDRYMEYIEDSTSVASVSLNIESNSILNALTNIHSNNSHSNNSNNNNISDNNSHNIDSSNSNINSKFSGHYILIVDFDHNSNKFMYLDPASDPCILSISREHLYKARNVPGTDHDVIFCNSD